MAFTKLDRYYVVPPGLLSGFEEYLPIIRDFCFHGSQQFVELLRQTPDGLGEVKEDSCHRDLWEILVPKLIPLSEVFWTDKEKNYIYRVANVLEDWQNQTVVSYSSARRLPLKLNSSWQRFYMTRHLKYYIIDGKRYLWYKTKE